MTVPITEHPGRLQDDPLAGRSTADPVASEQQEGEEIEGEAVRKGRVLVVAPEPFYTDRGTPICVRQVLVALTQLGYNVDVLTYPIGRPVGLDGIQVHRSSNPFRIRHVPIGFSMRKLLLDGGLFAQLRRLLASGRYQVVHALEESAFAAAYWGRKYGVPVIYDMHSSMAEQMGSLPLFRNRVSRSLFNRAERWLLRRASQVVSSAGLAQRVRQVAPTAQVMEWQFSSEVHSVEAGRVAALRESLGIRPGQKVVLYSGTFERYQGLRTLLEAVPQVVQEVPGTVFLLVGVDGEHAAARVARLARVLDRSQLKLIERQPRENIPAYFALADVLVSPRLFGGNLPLKVFDYMAAGRPIVATDIPSHRSVLSEDRAVLVRPDRQALASAISGLLRDPVRARQLAAAGQRFARENLAWSTFVRSVNDLYESVCPSPPSRAD
jgi:glycosyltransferase involved in cell wall biosynthesis